MATIFSGAKRWVEGAALVAALTVGIPGVVGAHDAPPAAGSLDPRFGNGGTALQDFSGVNLQVNGLAVDHHDRIVVASSTHQSEPDSSFLLTRYRPDGTPDPSFGGGNGVLTSFSGSGANADAVAIQPDGRIVVAGFISTVLPDGSGTTRFALARYHGDGALDASFGDGGLVVTDFGAGLNWANAVAIQHDGRIVVAGQVFPPGGPTYHCGVARYERDGSLDASFGSGGMAIADFGGAFNQACYGVGVQRDGKVVAAGFNKDAPGVISFAVVRFKRDGSLDDEFGTGGKAFAHFGGASGAWGMTIQRDGKIVLVGEAAIAPPGPVALALVRFDQHGVLDPSFGTGGQVTTEAPGGAEGWTVAIDRFDRVVAAGTAFGVAAAPEQFLLTRFDSNGMPDATFGTGGAVLTSFGDAGANATGLGILNDGDIVVGGTSGTNVALARYAAGPQCRRDFDR